VKKLSQFLGSFLIIALFVQGISPTTVIASAPNLETIEWQEVMLTNNARIAVGLNPLVVDSAAQQVAELRAQEIIAYFSHTRPNGADCFTAFSMNYSSVGENIAYGYPTAADVHKGWMNSPGHYANIVRSSFDTIGVGHYRQGNVDYWAQSFVGYDKSAVSASVYTVSYPTALSIEDMIVILEIRFSDGSYGYAPVSSAMATATSSGYNVRFGSLSVSISANGTMQSSSNSAQSTSGQAEQSLIGFSGNTANTGSSVSVIVSQDGNATALTGHGSVTTSTPSAKGQGQATPSGAEEIATDSTPASTDPRSKDLAPTPAQLKNEASMAAKEMPYSSIDTAAYEEKAAEALDGPLYTARLIVNSLPIDMTRYIPDIPTTTAVSRSK